MDQLPPLPSTPTQGPGPHPEALRLLLQAQAGVITRRQFLALGYSVAKLRSLAHTRWQIVHRGVYVAHNGPLTRLQREWAACLAAWPAALCRQSALPTLCPADARVHVAVPNPMRVRGLVGVVVHEMFDFPERVRWTQSPPRIIPEHTVLDLGRRTRDEYETVALLARAVQLGLTTPRKLRAASDSRLRVRHRAFVERVLVDIEQGVNSALEYAFATLVEENHALPAALRQVRVLGPKVAYRDVEFAGLGVIVELDGWQFHRALAQREADLQRDLETRVAGRQETVRLSWRQVTRDACRTASLLGQILQRNGWRGTVQPCPECPPQAQSA